MTPPSPAPTVETLTACPLCGGRSLAAWHRGRDRQHRLSPRLFRYSRCRGCGLYFLSTRPAEEDVKAFYPPDYGPYHAPADGAPVPQRPVALALLAHALRRLNDGVGRLAPDRARARLEALYEPPGPGARLLDFGCGSTHVLDQARAAGWRTIGLDFSPAVIERVRAGGHEAHLVSPHVWGGIADASLDLVRLHHVLEHLYRPREVLAEVARKMKPGARLHVGLPNPGGLAARIFGERWWGLECPRHVMLYRERVAAALLGELGFQDVEVIRDAVTKDLVRSWGYWLGDLGWMSLPRILVLPGGSLAEALRLPMRAAAAVGLADRFHVVARKAPS